MKPFVNTMNHQSQPARPSRPHHSFLTPLALAALTLAGAGQAQDDRENSTPTGHALYSGLNATEVNNLVSQGYRIVDIEVDPAQAKPFTVSLVRNTGTYNKTWWWYYGLTAAQVSSYLSTNSARLYDLERYVDGGQVRYACLMESNTGPQSKAWWYTTSITWSSLMSFVQTNNARIIDLESYLSGNTRYYTAVMLSNTGADQRSWWTASSVTMAQVSSMLSTYNAYPIDLEPLGNGQYSVVMNARNGRHYWYYYGLTLGDLWHRANQNGARLIDVERYVDGGQVRFAGVMLNNSNEVTTRAGQAMRSATDGVVGLYLKRLNGTTHASLMGSYACEPASMMKTLLHVHAMRRVHLGSLNLNSNWSVATSSNGSCPTGGAPFNTLTVREVLRTMMENSSNTSTLRVMSHYGMNAFNTTATALGMTETSLNHTLGCGGPTPNQLSLRDLARLHEEVANGYLGNQREEFYTLMLNALSSYPSWGAVRVGDLIDQEAANVGLSVAARNQFKSQTYLAVKPGSYSIGGRQFRSVGGYLRLPFVANAQIVEREYTTGVFVHDASTAAGAEAAAAAGAIETIRAEVRAALQSWVGVTFGSFTSFGTACPGSNGLPSHGGTGNPAIGNSPGYRLLNGPMQRPVVLQIGGTQNTWNGFVLPLSLMPIGGGTCAVRVAPSVSLNTLSSMAGQAVLNLAIPNSSSLVGQSFRTQYWCLDAGVNALGVTTSNGMTTVVGGRN